jgi:hypothetical protein
MQRWWGKRSLEAGASSQLLACCSKSAKQAAVYIWQVQTDVQKLMAGL